MGDGDVGMLGCVSGVLKEGAGSGGGCCTEIGCGRSFFHNPSWLAVFRFNPRWVR